MPFDLRFRMPHPPRERPGPRRLADTRGDGLTGGCLSLIVILLELPAAGALALALTLRGLARSSAYAYPTDGTGPPPTDWVPVLWIAGFTLAVLGIAVALFRTDHPYAGAVQLVIAVFAPVFLVLSWHS